MGFFLDLFSGKSGFSVSDNMAVDEDGDFLMKMSDNMAMDMDSGELHLLSSFSGNAFEEDDNDW